MRQTRLNALSYEPVLTILVEKVEETGPFHIKVKNIGEYPAYNVFVHSDSAIHITPKSKLIGVLGRGQEETLWNLSEEAVSDLQEARGELRIDIDYTNILNEDGGHNLRSPPSRLDISACRTLSEEVPRLTT